MCTQWWRGDDGELHFCSSDRGHSGECTDFYARRYSETVTLI